MGATALLALGHRDEELAAARLAVLRARGSGGSWPYEDFVVHGFGAPAWTTAEAVTCGSFAANQLASAELARLMPA